VFVLRLFDRHKFYRGYYLPEDLVDVKTAKTEQELRTFMLREVNYRHSCFRINGPLADYMLPSSPLEGIFPAAPTADLSFMGLSATATADDVRKRYKRMALELHPDHGGSADAFRQLTDIKDRLLALLQDTPT
jgi:hypothetical protein